MKNALNPQANLHLKVKEGFAQLCSDDMMSTPDDNRPLNDPRNSSYDKNQLKHFLGEDVNLREIGYEIRSAKQMSYQLGRTYDPLFDSDLSGLTEKELRNQLKRMVMKSNKN